MPSTSNVNKQRNSSSTNYNESSQIISQIPRQILPMSRPTTTTTTTTSTNTSSYQQPQIIVPTQCGFGDMLQSKDISSNVLIPSIPSDYYNIQFGTQPSYTTYFSQQLQHQQIFSQQIQHHQHHFLMQHQINNRQQQQQQQFDNTLCDDCKLLLLSTDSLTLQNLCNKCKVKYIGIHNNNNNNNNYTRISRVVPRQSQQQQQQQQQQQHHSLTPSHVVPTQTLMSMSQDVSQSITDYSISAANMSDQPIDFSLDHQSPTICYDENSDKNSSKNSVLNDVFFSDPMIEDTDEVCHFDSDSSSDTDILTPRQRYSPPLSPIDLMGGDDLLWSIIYEKDNKQPSSTNEEDVVVASSTSAMDKMDLSSTTPTTISSSSQITTPTINTTTTTTTTSSPPSSSSSSQVLASLNSNVTTIDPTLICSNPSVNSFDVTTTIDPRFIETSSVTQNVKRLTPVITRPNHIEFGDGIPSPPLKTPELVSDHSVKRNRMSCESSSDDDISDSESNDNKRAQKKFRIDIKKSININNNNDNNNEDEEDDDEDDDEDESGSEESSVNGEMDSSNETYDAVTDEYHYSSNTDSEEDDDEEYRPTTNNKKYRNTRKSVKSQGKARNVLSKSSIKTKSAKNKSKASTKRGKKTSKPSSKRSSGVSTPTAIPVESPPQCITTPVEESQEMEGLEVTSPRPTQTPTIFQTLTKSGIDWCRYCGTTEGVNWRPGPWGKRTLCNKHGCDYKGYGFACKLPRLDLTGFINESVEERDRPVLQLFCTVCQKKESYMGNVLVRCEGCFKAYHQKCCSTQITDEMVSSSEQWFCEASCSDNVRRKRIVVELPRKKLPLMSTPKVQVTISNIETGIVPSGTVSRPRTSRNSSKV